MARTPPNAGDIKARFPEFSSVDSGRIKMVIDEVAGFLDDSWIERDYAPAYRFLVAHNLIMEGVLTPSGLLGAGVASGQITSYSLGDASVSYANNSSKSSGSSMSDDELARTTYGARFAALRRANHGGPMVVE